MESGEIVTVSPEAVQGTGMEIESDSSRISSQRRKKKGEKMTEQLKQVEERGI